MPATPCTKQQHARPLSLQPFLSDTPGYTEMESTADGSYSSMVDSEV